MVDRPVTRAIARRLAFAIPYVQGRLPHDLYRHIFEFLARPHFEENNLIYIDVSEITPFLPKKDLSPLKAISLTCKHFREIVCPLLVRHMHIYKFADFRRRTAVVRHRSSLPMETLAIGGYARNKYDPIQIMTSANFLSMMKKCDRLWSLTIINPIINEARLDSALVFLSQCTFFTNITTLVLTLRCRQCPRAEELVEFIMMMPNLTRLHHNWDIRSGSDYPTAIVPYPDLPPPPFRLEYLRVTQGYWNVDWLTSTSHKSLRCARIEQNPQHHKVFNLDHKWTALGSLHLFGDFDAEQVLKVFESSPNLVDFIWEMDCPYCEDGEMILMGFINALRRSLHHITFWHDKGLGDNVGPKFDYTALAAAVQSHPNLSKLKSMTISLTTGGNHERCENRFSPLKTACEARGIDFSLICCDRCKKCRVDCSGRSRDIQVIAGL